MAATNLLTLIDDIAALLDEVALMTKIAARKTAAVVSDDLALSAEQLSGVSASREIPIVLAVAKGSLVNKAILVPCAILISAFAHSLIMPLLLMGGLYLCFEGFEKIISVFFHRGTVKPIQHADSKDIKAYEKSRIKGAIRTDFVLSTEIIIIALGSVASASLVTQIAVLSLIGVAITIGVYGIVACIVKLDDLGLLLVRQSAWVSQKVGRLILRIAPYFMKLISVIGTIAMFLVGGSIIIHAIPLLQVLDLGTTTHNTITLTVASWLFEIIIGITAGALLYPVVTYIQRIWVKKQQ